MSQDQKNNEETVDTSVEIPMSIDAVVKRNCGLMKTWSANEIAEMFNIDGKLTNFHPAHILPRVNLVKRTRQLTVLCLQLLFEENIPLGFRLPTKAECSKLANEIISEKNIWNKFNQTIIISVRLRPYTSAEFNIQAVNFEVEFQDITYPF